MHRVEDEATDRTMLCCKCNASMHTNYLVQYNAWQ